TGDGSIDFRGDPAVPEKTGRWTAAIIILLNQGLATLAFFGVGVNLVLFLTRVLQQDNAAAANAVSRWTGTVYIFSLLGAFLSDSYWGRYKTCAIFQAVFVSGLVLLSLTTHVLLLKPANSCAETPRCRPHSSWEIGLFYVSMYLIALGNGGYQPNIATFGADQFDEGDAKESHSKVSFFSYFYLALNLGALFSNTILSYVEDKGLWAHGFWASSLSALVALALFIGGTVRYRYLRPSGNPCSRFSQVIVAASRKWRVQRIDEERLFSVRAADGPVKKSGVVHNSRTNGFKFLDKAAYETPQDKDHRNPWLLCPVSQVEEVKCILRLLPIWLCTIIYSVVFTQMASLFVVQGAAMNTTIFSSTFKLPPSSMSIFDILTVALFIFLDRRRRLAIITEKGVLHRMGTGLVVSALAMLSAGAVECYRLKYATQKEEEEDSSSLSMLWQIPQYCLIGASEVFMYVGQLEFFNAEAPEGLKSFGSALSMTSISVGNYASSLMVTAVMKITGREGGGGWIGVDLNKGHLERFYFLLAGLSVVDLGVYVGCAVWYNKMKGDAKCAYHPEEE
ncbi:hypothetical protein M569_07006, partial [Genlisea aurea]